MDKQMETMLAAAWAALKVVQLAEKTAELMAFLKACWMVELMVDD